MGIPLPLTPLQPPPLLTVGWGKGADEERGPVTGKRSDPLPSSLLLRAQASLRPLTSPASASRSTVRPQPVTPRRRYLRCWGGSPAPGGAASFRPGPRAVPPIPYLGTPGGWGGGWSFRRAAFRWAALGQLPPRLRRFRGDSSVDTADPRASARYSPGLRGKRGAARAGGGVVWSPSNRGTPRETPLRNYAGTHRGGIRGLP